MQTKAIKLCPMLRVKESKEHSMKTSCWMNIALVVRQTYLLEKHPFHDASKKEDNVRV